MTTLQAHFGGIAAQDRDFVGRSLPGLEVISYSDQGGTQ